MNKKLAFCITLGHNSSCAVVHIHTGQIISAYEEERFSRIKSDKNFAINSINKCIEDAEKMYGPNRTWRKNGIESEIFVSHWYDNFEFYKNRNAVKHERYNYDFMEQMKDVVNCKEIQYLSSNITHHDAHAYGALAFYKSHKKQYDSKTGHILVIDGFGNNQEVLSIYTFNINEGYIKKVFKYYGYKNSLGLMYEFATEFMGMKPHEDEYKALGYESKIRSELTSEEITTIYKYAIDYADEYMREITAYKNEVTQIDFNPDEIYINVPEFEQSREYFFEEFSNLIKMLNFNDNEIMKKRVAISYFIQTVLEKVTQSIVYDFCNQGNTTLLVSGGVAFNVKMNNNLMRSLNYPMDKHKFCAYPLAGDQGAAIGFYQSQYGNLNLTEGNLCFGERDIKISDEDFDRHTKKFRELAPDIYWPIHIAYNKDTFRHLVVSKLLNNEIVQVIHGNMEFGPRALLSNSTLAVATEENVDTINAINGRNTVMPFAPLVTEEGMKYLFDNDYECVVGSLRYMILTLNYKQELCQNQTFMNLHKGVMHNYPELFHDLKGNAFEGYSGRPQVIDKNSYMFPTMETMQQNNIWALIQTSFNCHGRPIVYSLDHIFSDFEYQLNKRKELGITKPICLIFCDFEDK